MSEVSLHIGGRDFRVACAEGEEEHISMLGRMIDGKVSGMGMSGQSEGRMLLFAALLLADEAHDVQQRGGVPAPAPANPLFASRLEGIAEALEKCAAHLEG